MDLKRTHWDSRIVAGLQFSLSGAIPPIYIFLVKFTKVAQNVSEKFFLQLYEHDWPMLENCTGWIITIRRPPFLLLEFELDRFSNMCELQLQSA